MIAGITKQEDHRIPTLTTIRRAEDQINFLTSSVQVISFSMSYMFVRRLLSLRTPRWHFAFTTVVDTTLRLGKIIAVVKTDEGLEVRNVRFRTIALRFTRLFGLVKISLSVW